MYYHGSDAIYEWPSFDAVDNWTEEDGRAAKVMLGYYVTTNKALADSIGKYTYAIELKRWAKVYMMTLENMKMLYECFQSLDAEDIVDAYIVYRNTMAEDYDVIDIVERDGSVGESIIINLGAIVKFHLPNDGIRDA